MFTNHPEDSGVEQKYWYKFENPKQITQLILTFEQQSEIPSIAIVDNNIKAAFKAWKQEIRYIKASGGIVRNNEGLYLFIYRLCKWDLPKGKMNPGETPEQTAHREIEEETCVRKLEIIRELPSTYHTYLLKDQFILKRTYWYEMVTADFSKCEPQTEEHIELVKWFNEKDFNIILENTYPSIRDVLNEIK